MEDKTLEAARNHYIKGDYQAALNLYLSLINTTISYKLYHRIGKCYYKMEDFEKAESFFKKSIGLQSGDNPSYIYLGNIYYKKADLHKAIFNWVNAFAYRPDNENLSINLATSYFSCGMKFQSIFYYEKYLKYAKEKTNAYIEVKKSLEEYTQIGTDFLQKAKAAYGRKNYKNAIEFLTFAYKNLPTNYEINYLLGTAYQKENDNMHAMIYLKNAFCINNKSLVAIQALTTVLINLGYYTTAYCMMERILPLIINNQHEYLETIKVINELKATFNQQSYIGHKEWGDNYYNENNFHFALFEYENTIILNKNMQNEIGEKITLLKKFLNPELFIIKNYLEKGEQAYNKKDFATSNKYFTKVIQLSSPESPEYKLAKARI